MTSVCIVADDFFPATLPPEAKINTELARVLAETCEPVHVFAGHGAAAPPGAALIRLACGLTDGSLVTTFRLARAVLESGAQTVIVMFNAYSYGHRPWISLLPLMLRYCTGYRGEVVVHFTNEQPVPFGRQFSRGLRLLEALGIRYLDRRVGGFTAADRLVFYCNHHRNLQLRGQNRLLRKSVVTPAPLTVEASIAKPQEITALRSRLGISASTPVILFFGLIYPGKGIEDLLQALARLRDRAVDAALLLVGQSGGVTSNAVWNKACDDYVLQMKTLADNLGLQDRAHWAGHVKDAELGAWFGVSSVACLPFSGGIRANNSTFAVCAAHGIPVVTTTWDGIDSVFQGPDSGIELVPCQNPDRLADALEEVLADSERLSAMSRHIRTVFERYFSWSRFVDVLLSRSRPEAV